MRISTNWRTLHSDQRGLESIEYLLITALIMLAAISAWRYLGETIKANSKKMASTIDSAKNSLSNGLSKTDKVAFVDPPPPPPPPPSPPPPPPVPFNPLGPGVRHHIGDGNFGQGMGGGSLATEGTTYSTSFNVTQEMLDYARENGGKLYIKYEGYGVQLANTISLNGRPVGTVADGSNTIAVDVSTFTQGSNVLTVTSSSILIGAGRIDYDDFEFNNLSIGYTR